MIAADLARKVNIVCQRLISRSMKCRKGYSASNFRRATLSYVYRSFPFPHIVEEVCGGNCAKYCYHLNLHTLQKSPFLIVYKIYTSYSGDELYFLSSFTDIG